MTINSDYYIVYESLWFDADRLPGYPQLTGLQRICVGFLLPDIGLDGKHTIAHLDFNSGFRVVTN